MVLTFHELKSLLSGQVPLPDSRSLTYSLPLSLSQLAELVPLLQDNEELRGLKLRGCRLDDDAAEALSRAVAFNASLRTLDLRDNEIGRGAHFLANALRNHNYTLMALDLSGNPAIVDSPEAVQEIAMHLHRNAQNPSPAGSPHSCKSLVRFQEVPPETPVGRSSLTFSEAELEHRFQELERHSQAQAEAQTAWAEYKATLDVASQSMAMVLEMLQKDVQALAARVDALPEEHSQQQATDAMPAAAGARLQQQCADLEQALARLREQVEGSLQQKQDLDLLVDAVQLMEEKVEQVAAANAGMASTAAVQKLEQQLVLVAAAATKAGGEAEAVAASMKAVGKSIQGLQAQVAAANGMAAEAQQQAAGSAEAVAALEQQVHTLQLNVEAVEQALDADDISRQLTAAQARAEAAAAEQQERAAAVTREMGELRSSLQAMEQRAVAVEAQVQQLAGADLPGHTAKLEAAVAQLEATASDQAAAVSQLAALRAELAAGDAALQQELERLGTAQADEQAQLRTELQSKLQELAAEQQAVEEQRSAQAGQLAGVAVDVAALRADHAAAASQLATTAKEVEGLRSQAQQQNAATAALLSELQASLAAAQASMEATSKELTALWSEHEAAVGRLAATEANGAEERRGSRSTLVVLEGQLSGMQQQVGELQAGLAAAEAGLQEAAQRQAAFEAELRVQLGQSVPAAELEKVQRSCEQLLEGEEAALAARAAELQGRMDRHQAAVLGQYAELQAGLAAVPVLLDGEQRVAATEAGLEQVGRELAAVRAEQQAAMSVLAPAAAVEAVREAAAAQHEATVAQLAAMHAAVQHAAEQVVAFSTQQGAELAAAQAAIAKQLAAAEAAAGEQRAAEREQLAALQARLAAAEAAQQEAAASLAAQVAGVKAAMGSLAPVEAVEQLRLQLEGQHDRLAAELAAARTGASEAQAAAIAELEASCQLSRAQAAGQLAELRANLEARLTAEVCGLREAAEAQRAVTAEQVAHLQAGLAAVPAAYDDSQVQERLGEVEGGLAAAQESAAALQRAVLQAQQEAAQGITSSAAAALVQEVARPLEQQLAALQQQQREHVAISAAELARLHQVVETVTDAQGSLQNTLYSVQQEHASLAEAVHEMRSSALAVAAAAVAGNAAGSGGGADTVIAAPAAAVPAISGARSSMAAASPVPSLRLGILGVLQQGPAPDIASFPLTERTLAADCSSDEEVGSGAAAATCGAAAAAAAPAGAAAGLGPSPALNARLAVQTKQVVRLEGVVAAQSMQLQEQRHHIHQLEAELGVLKQVLLMGGSPPLASRPFRSVASTPASAAASQPYFDASESMRGYFSSGTTASRHSWRTAASPAGSASTAGATPAGSQRHGGDTCLLAQQGSVAPPASAASVGGRHGTAGSAQAGAEVPGGASLERRFMAAAQGRRGSSSTPCAAGGTKAAATAAAGMTPTQQHPLQSHPLVWLPAEHSSISISATSTAEAEADMGVTLGDITNASSVQHSRYTAAAAAVAPGGKGSARLGQAGCWAEEAT